MGCLPIRGREGVNLTTTTGYLLNNSKIEDFTRARLSQSGRLIPNYPEIMTFKGRDRIRLQVSLKNEKILTKIILLRGSST